MPFGAVKREILPAPVIEDTHYWLRRLDTAPLSKDSNEVSIHVYMEGAESGTKYVCVVMMCVGFSEGSWFHTYDTTPLIATEIPENDVPPLLYGYVKQIVYHLLGYGEDDTLGNVLYRN